MHAGRVIVEVECDNTESQRAWLKVTLEQAIDVLRREQGIDLLSPDSMTDSPDRELAQNFHELSMREAFRVDL